MWVANEWRSEWQVACFAIPAHGLDGVGALGGATARGGAHGTMDRRDFLGSPDVLVGGLKTERTAGRGGARGGLCLPGAPRIGLKTLTLAAELVVRRIGACLRMG